MNGYVALILDLDGTLLDENKKISSENLEALKNLKQKGIHIGIFTGRDFEMARGYLDSISAEGPHALQNGALVITGKGKIIDCTTVSPDLAHAVIDMAKGRSCDIILREASLKLPDWFRKDRLRMNPYLPFLKAYSHRIEYIDDLHMVAEERRLIQIDVTGLHETLTSILKNCLLTIRRFQLYASQTSEDSAFMEYYWNSIEDKTLLENVKRDCERWGLLSIFGSGISKGKALDSFLEYHNVSPSKVVFIGDHLADIPLMRRVGMPIAVANAMDVVKEESKYITSSNSEGGVAKAISVFFADL
jgi:HAD superfamily hydrolase (TIGR01484 family)